MSQPTTKGCHQTISRNKLVTHTIWLDAITWKILRCLSSKQPERKPSLHGNMLQLTSVHRVVFNTNWKRKLNTICHLFPPRFPFPLLSKGCADFQYTVTLDPSNDSFVGQSQLSKKLRKHFERRTKPTLCPWQDSIELCSKDNGVCFFFFFFLFLLRCVFKRTHRW